MISRSKVLSMKKISFSLSQFHSKRYNKVDYSEEEILSGILDNDNSVITYIYEKYKPKIRRMVFTFKHTALDPDDIYQEGFCRAIFSIRNGKFRRKSSIYTYLSSICRNICLKDLVRKKIKTVEITDSILEENAIDFEFLNCILEATKHLNENCIEIINLRFDLNESEPDEIINPSYCKTFEEIANILGLTADNARQRFKRCMKTLREYLNIDSKQS